MTSPIQGSDSPFLQRHQFIFISLSFVAIAQLFLTYFRIRLSVKLADGILNRLREDIFSKILESNPLSFQEKNNYSISHRMSEDLSLMRQSFINVLPQILRQTLVFLISFVIAISISPLLFSVMFAFLLPILLVIGTLRKRIRLDSQSFQDALENIGAKVEILCQGLKEVKMLGNEIFQRKKFSQNLVSLSSASSRYGSSRGMLVSLIIFFSLLMIFMVIAFGAWFVSLGKLNVEEYTRFLLFSIFASLSLSALPELFAQWTTASSSSERIREILNLSPERKGGITTFEETKGIHFEEVQFAYPHREEQKILKSISFSLDSDEFVALVGANGAGKSTILSLLMGFISPGSGKISLQGQSSEEICLKTWREKIAYIPQEISLFEGSILENLHYGNLKASKEEILKLAEKTGVSAFVRDFPKGHETLVGRKGMLLSGGQKQRIAIARVLLRNPEIILFDEPMNSLDQEGFVLIERVLREFSSSLRLIIAHERKTIELADRILFLQGGRIEATGKHEELLEKNFQYKSFFEGIKK